MNVSPQTVPNPITRCPGRVLIAKPGLDGHDRGAKIIAQSLRDAGFEVIYLGIRHTPQEIAAAAVQEDVDAVGLSILSGSHLPLFQAVLTCLKEAGADDIPVLGGGIIPPDDVMSLKAMGVQEIFTPGTPITSILNAFRSVIHEHRSHN